MAAAAVVEAGAAGVAAEVPGSLGLNRPFLHESQSLAEGSRGGRGGATLSLPSLLSTTIMPILLAPPLAPTLEPTLALVAPRATGTHHSGGRYCPFGHSKKLCECARVCV